MMVVTVTTQPSKGERYMSTKSRVKSAKTVTRGLKLVLILLIITTVFVLLPTITNAEPTNETIDDTWFDTHWGGDTGEEVYKEPLPPVIEEEEEEPTNMCGLSIPMVGVCLSAAGVWYVKKRRELKLE